MVVCSIDKEQPIILSSSPGANIPCERAHIRDNTLAYWSEDASGVTIHVCNLETLNTQTLLLPRDARVENAYSNGKITAWFENYYSTSIFIYDHAKHALYSIEEYVFSIDLVDRTVLINTGDSIIAYDLDNNSRHVLIEPNSQQRYIMARVTSDNKFIAFSDMPDGSVETTIVER
ncbi:MAG TPA: hypothetical protein GXX34_01445 [Clostridia bacterium]|nr:hypothetical protein [Clostridia bacterium]